ncbi:MAG: hypothetical protein QOD57_592 [Actinomycetota bacterium]|nr:hypothetical protein [Actinomycetota bacterium]
MVLTASLALASCGTGSTATAKGASTTTTVATTTTLATTATTTPNRVADSSPTVAATSPVRAPVVVGLGNSVPSGTACSCQNFVSAYAALVAAATNTKPTVNNDAVPGSTSADVVNQLATATVQGQLRSATTVLIMTGANDFNDAFDQVSLGAPAPASYGPVATAVQDNVTAIAEKIHAINAAAHVVVLDYWAAMEDGAVAAKDYDAPTMAAAVASTTYVNNALAVAAKTTGTMYVSTYTAFKGPNGTADPTALLAADGDHPDAAGHQVIAKAIYAVLPNG